MAQQDPSASERIAAALELLKPVAKDVSQAAAELSKPIVAIESVLKGMNIAFEAWVTYRSVGDRRPYYTEWDLGYSRVEGRWGICLREVEGDDQDPEGGRVQSWHFNESPLYMRQRAVDKLPDLIEALAKTGATVAHKLNAAAGRANAIAQPLAPKAKK